MQGYLAGRFNSHDVAIDFNGYHIRIVVDGEPILARGTYANANVYTPIEAQVMSADWLDKDHEQVMGLFKFLSHALWLK